MKIKYLLLIMLFSALGACESKNSQYKEDTVYSDADEVPVIYAVVETEAVDSSDDAADDPAIWYNVDNPAESLILGTDKQSGLGFYSLDGQMKHFIPAGRPNNVDVRQGLRFGRFQGDLAAASNREGDEATLFSINAEGGEIIGSFPAGLPEPYGSCMGMVSGQPVVFITYKTGEVQAHLLQDIAGGSVTQSLLGTIELESQLEGCVHDDATGVLYIGEEEHGLWRSNVAIEGNELTYTPLQLLDEVNGESGITEDIEGVTLYSQEDGSGYVVISSQGNDSYAVYERGQGNGYLGRFRIGNNETTGIDGAQDTDGIEVSARSFGPGYPKGILVVQDGYNAPAGQPQNFKIVDWRDVEQALGL